MAQIKKYFIIIVVTIVVILCLSNYSKSWRASSAQSASGITKLTVRFPGKGEPPNEFIVPEGYDFQWGYTDNIGRVACDNNLVYLVGREHYRDTVGDHSEYSTMNLVSEGEPFTVPIYIWKLGTLNEKEVEQLTQN